MIRANGFTLSKHRRKQFFHIKPAVLDAIESMVADAFRQDAKQEADDDDFNAAPR